MSHLSEEFQIKYHFGSLFSYSNVGLNTGPMDIQPHFHNSYEVYLFIKGDAEYSVEGNKYSLEPYDLMLTNNHEIHTPIFHSTAWYERKTLIIKPGFLSAFITQDFNPLSLFENRTPGTFNKVNHKLVLKLGIDKMFEEIETAMADAKGYAEILVKTILIQLFIKLSENFYFAEQNYTNNEKVSALIQYISNHLDQNLDYETLAKKIFVSKNYLYRLFKMQTGIPLSEYIKIKRISKAKELLAEGENSSKVAQAVGFSEYSSFFRAFKGVTEISPRKFADRKR